MLGGHLEALPKNNSFMHTIKAQFLVGEVILYTYIKHVRLRMKSVANTYSTNTVWSLEGVQFGKLK